MDNSNPFSKLKVALVNDFLIQSGGAERVLEVLSRMFREAPIFTLIADYNKAAKRYEKDRIKTSWLERLPGSISYYQWYLPFMAQAIESFNFDDFDVVISGSSAFAKGILTQQKTLHLCYCHSPTRYLWTDTHSYVQELNVNPFIKKFLPWQLTRLRQWDFIAAQRPDVFIANSVNIQKRIDKYYHRKSSVIYPPVQLANFSPHDKIDNYFLAGGRLVAYKKFDLLVGAFNRLGIRLKIFGEGPFLPVLKKSAKKNVQFLGKVSQRELSHLYARARAFINPQEEDFGITMVEAMASGRPVIAYKAGGALEILKPGLNGIFFEEQSWEALADTVVRFRADNFKTGDIIESVQKFSEKNFKEQLLSLIKTKLA